MLSEFEDDVGDLRYEELLDREADGVARAREAGDELGADRARDRAAEDGGGPDLLVGEHAEDLAEPVELLLEHAVYYLVGGVAGRDARPAGGYDGVYVGAGEQVHELRPDARRVVPDDAPLHDLVAGAAHELLYGVPAGIVLRGAGVAYGQNGQPDMFRRRLPVPVDALAHKRPPPRNGLWALSSPTVLSGPWPGSTLVSSGSVRSLSFMLRIRRSMSPPRRSVLPTLPAKSASPESTSPS